MRFDLGLRGMCLGEGGRGVEKGMVELESRLLENFSEGDDKEVCGWIWSWGGGDVRLTTNMNLFLLSV